jgi:DNA-binding transcriptional LysR family regulator
MNRAPETWQWDDVRIFLAAARSGSFSAAARSLGVGHVTVGRRIAQLERRLAAKLLARTPDGLEMTAAGEAIFNQCVTMEHAAQDLERIAAGQDAALTGQVRLTTTEALAHQLVAPTMAALRLAHPSLQIELTVGVHSLDIARREADIAIRLARPHALDLCCRKLGEVGFALYASPDYLAARGAPTPGAGLAGHDLITYRGVPAAMSPFFMGESQEDAHTLLRCDSALFQQKAAADGLGIAELTCFMGDHTCNLVRVWPHLAPVRRSCWLIVHQDLRHAARIRAVTAAIEASYRRQRRMLESGGAA